MKKPFRCFVVLTAAVFFSFGVFSNVSAEGVSADITWHDAAKLRIRGKGWDQGIQPYRRLPDRCKGKVPDDVWMLGGHSAGLNLQFRTNSQWITLRWTLTSDNLSMHHMASTGVSGLDLYTKNDKGKWYYVTNARPTAKTNTIPVSTGNVSGKMREYKVYLPLYNGIESLEIGVSQGKVFEQLKTIEAKAIVYYGTSITQGACASRPGMAYISMLERKLNRPIVNLGFSGAGKMEPVMADLIAELDTEIFVIDCLWNLMMVKPQELQSRIINMAKTLRKAHPETPILFVGQSCFKGPYPTKTGLVQRKTIETLRADGFKNIHLLKGKYLLGDDGEGTVDGCHPNDLGMMRHANAIETTIKRLLKENR